MVYWTTVKIRVLVYRGGAGTSKAIEVLRPNSTTKRDK